MQKPTIAFDIDDVLSASAPEFVAYSNARWGTNLGVEDYDDHWAEMWHISHDETEKRALEYHADAHFAGYPVIDQSVEILHELKSDFRLISITSRRQTIERVTRDWIRINYKSIFEGIFFAGIFDDISNDTDRWAKTKADHYIKHEVDYVVDDQLKHCYAAAGLGKQALLFGDYSWNRLPAELPPGVTRVADWENIRQFFASIR